jgi:hypothetical protein
MPLLEDQSCSFIVRVWRETSESPNAASEWRGSIEKVPAGRRAFFRELPAILDYMKPHLEELGIDPSQRFWEHMSPSLEDENASSGGAATAPRAPIKRTS